MIKVWDNFKEKVQLKVRIKIKIYVQKEWSPKGWIIWKLRWNQLIASALYEQSSHIKLNQATCQRDSTKGLHSLDWTYTVTNWDSILTNQMSALKKLICYQLTQNQSEKQLYIEPLITNLSWAEFVEQMLTETDRSLQWLHCSRILMIPWRIKIYKIVQNQLMSSYDPLPLFMGGGVTKKIWPIVKAQA